MATVKPTGLLVYTISKGADVFSRNWLKRCWQVLFHPSHYARDWERDKHGVMRNRHTGRRADGADG